MSPTLPQDKRTGCIIDASLLFSANAFPVGSRVIHPQHGEGLVMRVLGYERSVKFQYLRQVKITDADQALAQMDGDEVESVTELIITHESLKVSQLRQKRFKALTSKEFNSDTKQVLTIFELKARHDNKHYHDSI